MRDPPPPPAKGTSRGKFGIRLGEIAYGLILTSRARLLTSRPAGALFSAWVDSLGRENESQGTMNRRLPF